jgi:hypothetical protein
MRRGVLSAISRINSAVEGLSARSVACPSCDLGSVAEPSGTQPASRKARSHADSCLGSPCSGSPLSTLWPSQQQREQRQRCALLRSPHAASSHSMLERQHVAPLPAGGARSFATSSPDRDALIDTRLRAVSLEHDALQKQLHGGFDSCFGVPLSPVVPPNPNPNLSLCAPLPATAPLADGSIAPSSERYQQLSRRVGSLQVVADGYGEIARLQQEVGWL